VRTGKSSKSLTPRLYNSYIMNTGTRNRAAVVAASSLGIGGQLYVEASRIPITPVPVEKLNGKG
jgi:hypothetical protein